MRNNYFKILEIEQNATEQEIKKAYRRLAKLYHPDVNKGAHAHEKFIEITEAYEFLMEHSHAYNPVYAEESSYEQRQTEDYQRETYERFREETRKRAEAQAKMRYEEFKKQHEAFQTSGLSDLGLLLTFFFRLIAIPVTIALAILPIALTIIYGDFKMLFSGIFFWGIALAIGWYIHDNWKNYWIPGKFYYNLQKIKETFTETTPSEEKCYYSPSHHADSKPYKIELLKLKDIKLSSKGSRQHNINYINDKATIQIPRSQKAFIVHSITIFVKVFSILGCLVFFNITSFAWRFIVGMFLGGIISTFILLMTNTKSNVTYLWSLGMIFRVCCWLIPIVLSSTFTFDPFNVTASDYIHFIITAIVLFDCVLMQLVNLTFGKYSYKPIIRQYKEADQYFKLGYKVYNDVFVVSVIYPLYRWIFG